MKDELDKQNLKVILIQIDEAHSNAWPRGLPNEPAPQSSFEDRVERANNFVKEHIVQYPVFVDSWDNSFAEIFQAWPDKYYCIDKDLKVIGKSEYGDGVNNAEAVILKDYTDLLKELYI